MPALDIFTGSAFSMVALTDAINKMPFVPGRIGQLGLFREQGVSTTSVMIEEREGSLTLVETTSRGAPAVQHVANKRTARSLTVPHVALEDTILADEVQNVRAFGSDNMLEGVQAVVNQRLTEMATKMDATLEHLRVGAIKGQILDADGTAVIYDLFTEFGVTAYTEVDFDLDNATPAPGAIPRWRRPTSAGSMARSCARARRAARSSTPASCSRSTVGGSARSTLPMLPRPTSFRWGCPGCSGSTTRRRISWRPPTPSVCRATPSRRSTSSSPAG
jgi:hypothetical protein